MVNIYNRFKHIMVLAYFTTLIFMMGYTAFSDGISIKTFSYVLGIGYIFSSIMVHLERKTGRRL